MKTVLQLAPLLALFLLLSAPARAQEAPERKPLMPGGKDLASNPDFEQGEGKRPAGWFIFEPPGGMKAEWGPFGIQGSRGIRFSPPGEGKENAAPAGVNRTLRNLRPGVPVEVTAWLRLTGFHGTCVVWARCDGGHGPEDRGDAFQNSNGAGYRLEGDSVWSPVTVRVTPGDETRALVFGVLAGGRGTVQLDALHAREKRTSPTDEAPKGGPGLYAAQGRYKTVASGDTDALVLLVPVPLLWRDQIPLSFRAWTEPGTHLGAVRLIRREHGFLVAEIRLVDLAQGKSFSFGWRSLVLVGPHEKSPIPEGVSLPLKDVPAGPGRWLASTWCAGWKDEAVGKVAKEILEAAPTADRAIPETLARMKTIFQKADKTFRDLTASSALTRDGSCTSCANLGASLLRGLGIPARIVAGYPTWSGPLQTHYVVEYWLPEAGWRVMESTRCADDRPGWEQIEVAVVLPEDETKEAAGARAGAAPGVPWLSLTEYPGLKGTSPIDAWLVGDMPGRPGCDHRATRIARFDAPDETWKRAREILSSRWTKRTRAAVEDDEAVGKLAPPEGLEKAESLDDLVRRLRE